MMRKRWPIMVMTVALITGIAHATLHLANADTAHFSEADATPCQLATVSACIADTAVPPPSPCPSAARVTVPDSQTSGVFARRAWFSRAPPSI